jgi:hypothetical protein
VEICITLTAAPITSAGRFSPLGPLGIGMLMLRDYRISWDLMASVGLPRNTNNTTVFLGNAT